MVLTGPQRFKQVPQGLNWFPMVQSGSKMFNLVPWAGWRGGRWRAWTPPVSGRRWRRTQRRRWAALPPAAVLPDWTAKWIWWGGGEGLRGGGYPPYLRKLNMPNHGAGAKWICNGRRHRMWDTTEGSCLFSKNNASLSGCQKLVNFDVISSLLKQSRCRGWKEVL